MLIAYIDTNIFLDFYQSSTDRLAVFEDILARANNVLLTQQTVEEFRRNRVARLTQLADAVKKGSHGQIHTTAVVQALPGFKDWVNARDATKAAALEIAKELTSWVVDEQNDLVLVAFEKLVINARRIATTPGLVDKARTRKLLGSPPTSPDKYTIGDELNWECLLTWTGSDIVIVTRDKTYLDNQAILKREFSSATGHQLVLVTDSLSLGLEKIGLASDKIKEAEKKLPTKEDEEVFPTDGKCSKCGGELEEEGYEGSDGDSAWWLYCAKCRKLFFPPHR
jgi:predicted nucleic acid-binding protein